MKNINFLIFLLLLSTIILSSFILRNSTKHDYFDPSNIEKSYKDKIFIVGKVEQGGVPQMYENMIDTIYNAVLNDNNTYKLLFTDDYHYSINKNSIQIVNYNPECEIYYLFANGYAFKNEGDSSLKNFIVAYQLEVDTTGNIWNVTKTKHVCVKNHDLCGCSFDATYYWGEITGCNDVNRDTANICNHTIFQMPKGYYHILKIK